MISTSIYSQIFISPVLLALGKDEAQLLLLKQAPTSSHLVVGNADNQDPGNAPIRGLLS